MKPIAILLAAILLTSCEKQNTQKESLSPKDIPLAKSTQDMIKSDNAFGFTVFQRVLENNPSTDNVFISPTSIALALAMTYNGAAGDTKTAMEATLQKAGLTTEEINTGYKSLIDALVSVDPKVLLEIANSIWYDQNFSVLQSFIDVNQQYYNALVSPLDFAAASASSTINGWVNDNTHGKIPEVIQGIPGDVVMYLINAIYFKGKWKFEFEKDNTEEEPFTLKNGDALEVPFMKQETTLPAMSNDMFSMVEMPYGQGNFVMDVMLPNDGHTTDEVVAALTPENWDAWIAGLTERNISIWFPKFKFTYSNLLNDELSDLGMGVAFSGDADFSGINGTGGLAISRVLHKSFVEVNEEGTEAAAVTVVEIELTSAGPGNEFKIDKPFLFAIREVKTGTILFMGRVQNPLTATNE
jgi:serpin B